jgi:hypothetical protein
LNTSAYVRAVPPSKVPDDDLDLGAHNSRRCCVTSSKLGNPVFADIGLATEPLVAESRILEISRSTSQRITSARAGGNARGGERAAQAPQPQASAQRPDAIQDPPRARDRGDLLRRLGLEAVSVARKIEAVRRCSPDLIA